MIYFMIYLIVSSSRLQIRFYGVRVQASIKETAWHNTFLTDPLNEGKTSEENVVVPRSNLFAFLCTQTKIYLREPLCVRNRSVMKI